MPRHQNHSEPDWNTEDDSWDEELDGDGPDDQTTTTACLRCGAEIYDDTSRCPICGEYQVGERTLTAWEGRPLWWRLGGLLGIIAVLYALLAVCL